MSDDKKRELETVLLKSIQDIHKLFLRKKQAEMYTCALNCCNDDSLSMSKMDLCVEQCSAKCKETQQFVQLEFQRFQERIQRCVSDCNDDIKDKMGSNPSELDINKYTNIFENCASNCVTKFIKQLPDFTDNLKSKLKNSNF